MGGQAQWSPGLRGTYPLACSQRCHRHRVSGTRRGRQRARWVCGRGGSHGPGRTWSLTVPLRAGCPLPPGAVWLSPSDPPASAPSVLFPRGAACEVHVLRERCPSAGTVSPAPRRSSPCARRSRRALSHDSPARDVSARVFGAGAVEAGCALRGHRWGPWEATPHSDAHEATTLGEK